MFLRLSGVGSTGPLPSVDSRASDTVVNFRVTVPPMPCLLLSPAYRPYTGIIRKPPSEYQVIIT